MNSAMGYTEGAEVPEDKTPKRDMNSKQNEIVLQYAALVMSMTLDFQMGKITPALYVSNLLLISNQLSEKFNPQWLG